MSGGRIEMTTRNQGFIALRSNNTTARETCPLCEREHKDADQPLWMFHYQTRAEAEAPKRGLGNGALCQSCAGERAHEILIAARSVDALWFNGLVEPSLLEPLIAALMAGPALKVQAQAPGPVFLGGRNA